MIEKEQFEKYIEELKSFEWNDMCNGADVMIVNAKGEKERFMYHLYFGDPFLCPERNLLNGYEQVQKDIIETDLDKSCETCAIIYKTPWGEFYYFEIMNSRSGYFMLCDCYTVEPYEATVIKYRKVEK